ncbi:MAG: hypothetical protein KA310_03220 [Pseudomonadales bacterium]|nr:hypothetical protein [Pseudomonadales bacterium]
MGYNDSQGINFDRTQKMDRPELKRTMLAAIDAMLRELPEAKGLKLRVTLRIRDYRSFDFTVSGLPDIHNPEYLKAQSSRRLTGYIPRDPPEHGPTTTAILAAVKAEASTFNYDRSDIQTDYFDVRFYLDVGPNREEARAQREALELAHSPLRTKRNALVAGMLGVCNDVLQLNGPIPAELHPRTGKVMKAAVTKLTMREHGTVWGLKRPLEKLLGADRGRREWLALRSAVDALDAQIRDEGDWVDAPAPAAPSPDLVAALEAARAENRRLRAARGMGVAA